MSEFNDKEVLSEEEQYEWMDYPHIAGSAVVQIVVEGQAEPAIKLDWSIASSDFAEEGLVEKLDAAIQHTVDQFMGEITS
jgi:hypothetical protein